MSTAKKRQSLSVEDYLAGEEISSVKFEYVDGRVYAMTGGTNNHSRIASRVLGALFRQLDQSPCEVLNSDTKIRVLRQTKNYFYYPDVSVVCQSNPGADTFQDRPVVVVEVVSESTRRIDEGEKRDHYLSLDSLAVYVLLEQSSPAARVYTRGVDGQFIESAHDGLDCNVSLTVIDAELRFSEIYAGVEFEEEQG